MRARHEAVEASAWTKFRLLMWKNFLQQWRHPIQTVVELLLPVATMALVLLLRSQIEPTEHGMREYPPIPAYSLEYSSRVLFIMNYTKISIAYSPESPVLENVIRNAVVNLAVRNLINQIELPPDFELPPDLEIPPDIIDNWNTTEIINIVKGLVRVTAYNSSEDLKSIYYDEAVIREVLAAVEFDDNLLHSEELPGDMWYKLRFPERPRLNTFYGTGGRSWNTDLVFPIFALPGPRFPYSYEGGNDPGYVNEMFIALQHAISMELISQLTGENLRQFSVNIQRYPHPPYIEDNAVEALIALFPMFMMLSFTYTAVNIIRAVTVEKELQLKETMKIMGLPSWLHWTAWFCKQFIYLLIASLLLLLILKINWFTTEDGFSEYSVFTNTPSTVLLFYLLLYMSCMIFFCFMISGFFSKASTAALFGGIIWFVSFIPAMLMWMEVDMSMFVQVLCCLSINTAMALGFSLLFSQESSGGMQWGDFFFTNSVDGGRLLFGHVIIILIADSILYMLIALYLEKVLPGPYGAPKPWYFPFQKSYWFPTVAPDVPEDTTRPDSVIKENDPTNLPIGVKMTNLTKIYGANTVVDNLNLNIYDNQITVLLGHNGAGKSTTISMLTGNVEVTRGTVTVAGHDITTHTSAARANLGLCPQHNVLFNELTVREHLEFFARLKGYKGKLLNEEIDNLIESLELQEKKNYQANGLSGGQKRRLCVGIALSGGARVVLLDEPTSGMDPSSRRALWELLQKIKDGRSMILTTHFMDEADFLGDRVAIMSLGRLQCVGSPYFLKRHYGIGYTLVIVKTEEFDELACTELIRKYIPATNVFEDKGRETTYKLPNEYSHVFEAMLTDLESNMHTIQFKNYGLIATTLEDVFMSVGSDIETPSESDETMTIPDSEMDFSEAASMEELNKVSESERGWRLLWLRASAVWLKLGLVWVRSWGTLALQVLVPILLMNSNLAITQYIISSQPSVVSRPLTLAEGYVTTETLLGFNGTDSTSTGARAKSGYEALYTADIDSMVLTDVGSQMMDQYYLSRTSDVSVMSTVRTRLLVGATLSDSSAVAWFSNFAYHDVATSLATLHEAILKGFNPEYNLRVFNHPLDVNYREDNDLQVMVTLLSTQVASTIGNALAIVSAVFIMFYIKERVTRAKLLQKAAGIQPVVMWGAAALFDWAWFMLLCLPILLSCLAFQVIGMSTGPELGRLFLALMVYGAAMLPLNYLVSLLFKGPAIGFVVMFFVNSLFGLMGAQIVEVLASLNEDTRNVATIMDYILQFFPLYSLVTTTRSLNTVGLSEYMCMQYCDYVEVLLPNAGECTMELLCDTISEVCCLDSNPYFKWEEPGSLRYFTCMLASCAAFWMLLLTFEYNWIQRLLSKEKKAPPIDASTLDADVAQEMEHVQRVNTATSEHVLLAQGLTKYYGKNLAVDQISFSVGEAEIFGLLGVNGAGKTTTFKMLMGDETVSSGNAFVSGYSIRKDITKVHENIGYCPQFDAVFGELTGRETLHLFSRFRGLRDASSAVRAETLANALGFAKHLDKRVDQYSGGNRRKLSTAVSLLGSTRLVFVDEPTTGVDPAAKRHVWRAVRAARRGGRSVVLTSHSMEECEALCSRLTIMVNGRFSCLGSSQHLKNKFSQGFTLTVKLKLLENARRHSLDHSRIEAVKNFVAENFTDPKLMEEYDGLLTFYLPDRTMAWSRMFGVMERAKRELDIEDYSILQTTLEQIFLQFTKYQKTAKVYT
ncbi:phospholipid-transporting ATPase ABCA1-like [Aricia agestis]|uniref:phospholipid-transporting ATPase ABCA1-like n=1 Tax=Aricia agestis TaxID=91739 RepID=UPI001C20BD6D|nr:phospholipid-transporting ATPase ABCA1-like [Aricia agestis]